MLSIKLLNIIKYMIQKTFIINNQWKSSKIENLKKLAIDTSTHSQHYSQALSFFDVNLSWKSKNSSIYFLDTSIFLRYFFLKFLIDWKDLYFWPQLAERSHDCNISFGPFIVYVLDNQSCFLTDILISTDRLVYLTQLPESLGEIHAAHLNDPLTFFISLSIEFQEFAVWR